jgi:thioredoxin 1
MLEQLVWHKRCISNMRERTADETMNFRPDNSPMFEVGEADFQSKVLQSKRPVLVEFWAPWSRPCQVLEKVLDEVASASVGKLRIAKVNADDNPDLSLWYDIQSIPTLLCFVRGTLRIRLVGTASKQAILAKIKAACAGAETGSVASRPRKDHEHLKPSTGP